MKVRAKFTVDSIKLVKDWREQKPTDKVLHTIEMSPVVSDGNENSKFWAATPCGKIEMQCVDPAAAGFELGKSYFVDFTPAE